MSVTEPNIHCGRRTEVKEEKLEQSFDKLPGKLKKDCLTETKVYLRSSNSRGSHNERSYDEVAATNLLCNYEKTINDSGRWEFELEERYTEDQIDSIMGMLSYMENKYNGFGRSNDESLYKDERESDVTQDCCIKKLVVGLTFRKVLLFFKLKSNAKR